MPFVQRQAVDTDRRTVSALVLCPLLVVTFDAQAAQRAGHELIKIALVRFDVVRDSRGCPYASALGSPDRAETFAIDAHDDGANVRHRTRHAMGDL
jgi:hypothetical protein